MTPFGWMFIKSYESLRNFILTNKSISTLVQLEYSAYEEATVPICTFVLSNSKNDIGYYYRLSSFKGGMKVQETKLLEILHNNEKHYFEAKLSDFKKIPGIPIAYWIAERFIEIFKNENIASLYVSGRKK